jgi:hypothetical protein
MPGRKRRLFLGRKGSNKQSKMEKVLTVKCQDFLFALHANLSNLLKERGVA